jgi:hypothetical protein
MTKTDLDELYEDLKELVPLEKSGGRPAREERIIAGFEEIQRFVDTHGRFPQHGEHNDIFERLYAVRLDRVRALEECWTILAPIDRQGLLGYPESDGNPPIGVMDQEELLQELAGAAGSSDITTLRHVRTTADKRAAEEIANREKCEEFDRFKPLFQQVQNELDTGVRSTRLFVKDSGFLKADIVKGNFFILGGQIAYVADVGDPIKAPNGELDARLRVIFSNGTESNLLRRSLQRALYKDDAGRRITDPAAGPLFAGESADDDLASGTIYVLRSESDDPFVAKNRDILHKIGVTGSDVKQRIANAELDPTYLMANVDLVATYELFNINRTRLEKLIHRVFDPARVNIQIKDRFGNPIVPQEWFLVPRFVIDEAVDRIRDGTITSYKYDPAAARLVGTGDS